MRHLRDQGADGLEARGEPWLLRPSLRLYLFSLFTRDHLAVRFHLVNLSFFEASIVTNTAHVAMLRLTQISLGRYRFAVARASPSDLTSFAATVLVVVVVDEVLAGFLHLSSRLLLLPILRQVAPVSKTSLAFFAHDNDDLVLLCRHRHGALVM